MNRAKNGAVILASLLGLLVSLKSAPSLAKSFDCGKVKFFANHLESNFGKVPVGTTRPKSLVVVNDDPHYSADISQIEAMPSPPFAVDTAATTCMKGELAPEAVCSVHVTCTPQQKGKFKGKVTISFTIKRCPEKEFTLDCEGVEPSNTPTATATPTNTATATPTATATVTMTATLTATATRTATATATIGQTPTATTTSTMTPTATPTAGPALFFTTGASLETGDGGTVAAYLLPLSSNPNNPPSGTFTGGSLLNSSGIAVDKSGNIYVAQSNAASIDVYAPGSSGITTPTRSIAGSNDTLVFPNLITLDSTPNIYVADPGSASCPGGGGEVAAFPGSGNGNIAPSANITCVGMADDNTFLGTPSGVALDSSKNIYVTNKTWPSVTIYPAGSTGNATPTAVIVGGNPQCGVLGNGPACCSTMSCPDNTQLGQPVGIALDSMNNIYVTNSGGPPGSTTQSVTIYSAIGAGTGVLNVAPVATIAGSNTLLNVPEGIVLDSSGNIYVANLEGGASANVTVYAPLGSSTGTLNETPIATINSASFVPGAPFGLAIGQFTPPPP